MLAVGDRLFGCKPDSIAACALLGTDSFSRFRLIASGATTYCCPPSINTTAFCDSGFRSEKFVFGLADIGHSCGTGGTDCATGEQLKDDTGGLKEEAGMKICCPLSARV